MEVKEWYLGSAILWPSMIVIFITSYEYVLAFKHVYKLIFILIGIKQVVILVWEY